MKLVILKSLFCELKSNLKYPFSMMMSLFVYHDNGALMVLLERENSHIFLFLFKNPYLVTRGTLLSIGDFTSSWTLLFYDA